MRNFIAVYLSNNYLLGVVSGTRFEAYYLYVSAAIVSLAILFRLFIYVKGGRAKAYYRFDRLWFYGYSLFGLFGLFIWFSRTQALSIFSTRIVSYLWLISLLGYTIYLIYYLVRIMPEKLVKYYEKKRKKKYLGK